MAKGIDRQQTNFEQPFAQNRTNVCVVYANVCLAACLIGTPVTAFC
jgi:hypothetical protein